MNLLKTVENGCLNYLIILLYLNILTVITIIIYNDDYYLHLL